MNLDSDEQTAAMNRRQILKALLPDWGPVRWILFALVLLVLLLTGISLFGTPDYEVLYSPMRLAVTAQKEKGRVVSYIIEVGNTGRARQDDVRMSFLKTAMDRCILPVKARNFGVTDRPITISNDVSTTTVSLGVLEPRKRVKVAFTLWYPEGTEEDPWEALFLGIEPAKGSAKEGDPGMTMVGRAWFTVFGRWWPF